MIDKNEFIKLIEEVAPPHLAADWDNSGLQIEPAARDIERILVALELTPDVVNEAKLGGYDLIIVHHPLFFGEGANGRNILQSDVSGRYAYRLLAEPPRPIGVYAAHTSFDAASGGLSDELRRLIGLTPWADRLHPDIAGEFSHIAPFVRLGRFSKPTDLAGAYAQVYSALGAGTDIRVFGDPGQNVLKIMTICGGGGEAIPLAVRTGCSLLITGDIRHHEWRLAEAEGLALIDAGHYYTERPFAPLMVQRLAEALGKESANVVINVSTDIRQPYISSART
jgi:dinuclear metal center protein, YbgI/SA1388 family